MISRNTLLFALCLLLLSCKSAVTKKDLQEGAGVWSEPIALYLFDGAVPTIVDQSAKQKGVPLKIYDNSKGEVSWSQKGGIHFGPSEYRIEKSGMNARVVSDQPAKEIVKHIKNTNAFSVELWFHPDNVEQTGPVRLFSISKNNGRRNLTIGHSASAYDFRIRTTDINLNGLPSLRTASSFKAKAELTQIILTYSDSGAVVYINGEPINWFFYEGKPPGKQLSGELSNWDENYKIILADEHSGDRAWKGTLYKVAIYDQAMAVNEIDARFKAGLKLFPK